MKLHKNDGSHVENFLGRTIYKQISARKEKVLIFRDI